MVWVQIRQCSVDRRGDVLSRPVGRCVRAFQVTVQDDYGLGIVVGRTAHRPVVALRLCRQGTIARDVHRRCICRPPVDKRCARWPVYISL